MQQTAFNPNQVAYSQDRCVICLDEFQQNEMVTTLTACSHIFHRHCVEAQDNCPYCRAPIEGRQIVQYHRALDVFWDALMLTAPTLYNENLEHQAINPPNSLGGFFASVIYDVAQDALIGSERLPIVRRQANALFLDDVMAKIQRLLTDPEKFTAIEQLPQRRRFIEVGRDPSTATTASFELIQRYQRKKDRDARIENIKLIGGAVLALVALAVTKYLEKYKFTQIDQSDS